MAGWLRRGRRKKIVPSLSKENGHWVERGCRKKIFAIVTHDDDDKGVGAN